MYKAHKLDKLLYATMRIKIFLKTERDPYLLRFERFSAITRVMVLWSLSMEVSNTQSVVVRYLVKNFQFMNLK